MNFKHLLMLAKNNDQDAKTRLFDMYRPLLIKEALVKGLLDEDLYQELQEVLLNAIKIFQM